MYRICLVKQYALTIFEMQKHVKIWWHSNKHTVI